MATQYAFGQIVTSGLVLSLDAADRNSIATGSMTWIDMSGNNIPVSLNNALSASLTNNSIDFFPPSTASAFNTSIYTINSAPISTLASEVSLDVWVNPARLDGTVYTRPVSPRVVESPQPLGFALAASAISYEINTTTGWVTGLVEASGVQVGRWVNITQTTSDSAKSFRTYVNGVQVINVTFTGTPNTGGGIIIGRGYYGAAWNYIGKVAAVRYYNRALTPAEVLQNYTAQKSRFGL